MVSLTENKTPIYPQSLKWSILKGEDQGNIMFVRRNDSAKQLIEHPDYKYRIGIAIPLLKPNSNGLPIDEETKVLHIIEDSLISVLHKNQDGLLVLVITTGGMREFVFYSRNPEYSKQSISIAQTKYKPHQLQFYIAVDSEWEVYQEYL